MTVTRARCLNTAVALVASIAGMSSGGSPGVRPRAFAADYPAHQSVAAFTIGAALIPRGEVRKIFAADLNGGGYIVIEVGIFPAQGRDVDLSPGDFMLQTDTGRVATRPADADAVAGAISREHHTSPAKQSDIYTTTGVTISRVPTIDPVTGRQTHTTVIGTEEGVGNGAPPYPVPAAGPNVGAIEQELWSKSLPDGKTAVPVAGYLYFPKPSGKANGVAWELTMDGAGGRVKLTLPDRNTDAAFVITIPKARGGLRGFEHCLTMWGGPQ